MCACMCEYVFVCVHAHISVCASVCVRLLWVQVLTCLYFFFPATISSVAVCVCAAVHAGFFLGCMCACVRVSSLISTQERSSPSGCIPKQ